MRDVYDYDDPNWRLNERLERDEEKEPGLRFGRRPRRARRRPTSTREGASNISAEVTPQLLALFDELDVNQILDIAIARLRALNATPSSDSHARVGI